MSSIIQGDCLEVMKTFPENHFTSIVTDPPYGLKFMGKKWDHGIPGIEFWKEMLRICRPGTFLLSFGGTRTYHRLTCAIEDAGWEIRDCLQWIYGSGFPKSHNNFGLEGYGTVLKPSHEPIVMAMKPLDGTFAKNVEKWGIGGLNIDGSRISGTKLSRPNPIFNSPTGKTYSMKCGKGRNGEISDNSKGRWPPNIILDEEAAEQLDDQSGITASRFFYCAKASPSERNEGLDYLPDIKCKTGCGGSMPIDDNGKERDRFKKIAKNNHPTVKPLKLMKYLINLIMPPENGLLLDPFAGSGSTILAAKQLGYDAIGIEKDPEYANIAKGRIDNYKEKKDPQLNLLEKLYG